MNFTKLLSKYGIESLIILLLIAYVINLLAKYLNGKGNSGFEFMTDSVVESPLNIPGVESEETEGMQMPELNGMQMPEIQPAIEQIGINTHSGNTKIPNLQLRKNPSVQATSRGGCDFNLPTVYTDKYDRVE